MKRKEFNGSLTFVLSCIWEVDLGLKVYLDDVGWEWGRGDGRGKVENVYSEAGVYLVN